MIFIYKTTKGYRGKFLLLLFTVLFSTVTGAMFPYVTGKIVDEIFYKQQLKGFLLFFFLYAGLYFINQCTHGVLNYVWAKLKACYVVDIRNESDILDLLLQDETAEKTFIMVTHRGTSVARCNRVIRM